MKNNKDKIQVNFGGLAKPSEWVKVCTTLEAALGAKFENHRF